MTRFNVYVGARVVAKRVSRKTAAEICRRLDAADQPGVDAREAVSPRFRVKRHPVGVVADRPWIVKDAARPAFLGHYATHSRALMAIDNIVRADRGMPPRLDVNVDEIREAMSA